MSDPTIIKSNVTIKYGASDGYRCEWNAKAPAVDAKRPPPPHGPLLDGLEELARLTELFGFGDEAQQRFDAARQRVREWRAKREAAAVTEGSAA